MIEIGIDYYLAWLIYILALIAAQFVVWKITSRLKRQEFKSILQICFFALLITPVQLTHVQANGSYWVPAFIAAVMDGLNEGFDAAVVRLVPVSLVMLSLLFVSLIWKLFNSKKSTHSS